MQNVYVGGSGEILRDCGVYLLILCARGLIGFDIVENDFGSKENFRKRAYLLGIQNGEVP